MTPQIHPAPDRAEILTPERCRIAELLEHPGSDGASLARATVAPGVTTQLHPLDVDKRCIVLSGAGRVEIAGRWRDIDAGEAALIPAGASQRVENHGAQDLILLCLCTPRFRPEGYRNLETGP